MELEKKLVEYVVESGFEDLPEEVVDISKNTVLDVVGTTIAGATAEGCEVLVNQVKEWGGKPESTILVHGGMVPAYNAALVNSTMARALDFENAMVPGIHIGASSVPTALAAAELSGDTSGKQLLTAIILGSELATRINLTTAYGGFDPTGVCTVFATTAIAGKILGLNKEQMLNALGLALNKAAGSFQSNIDGTLAVRVIQGFSSQSGILCALLAQKGITGPKNFLEGIYGYYHLYSHPEKSATPSVYSYSPETIIGQLGQRFEFKKTMFKKYPSCGGTSASIDAVLDIVCTHDIKPDDIEEIKITVTPAVYNLVGHKFKVGDNPRVNAQFNIQYAAANAVLRRSCKLIHYEEEFIRDPGIYKIIDKVHPQPDRELDKRGNIAMDMELTTKDGKKYFESIDSPKGFPGNPLTKEEHLESFRDCLDFAKKPLPAGNAEEIVKMVNTLERVDDVRNLISLLV